MKVLLAYDMTSDVANGVSVATTFLTKMLRSRGHEVKYLTLSNTKHSHIKDDVVYIGSVDFGFIYPGVRVKVPYYSPALDYLQKWNPDVIHINCEFSTFKVSVALAKRCKCPVVFTAHTVWDYYVDYIMPIKPAGKAIVKNTMCRRIKQCDAVIAPTRKMERFIRSYGVEKEISIIPSGVDLTKFINSSAEKGRELRRGLGIPDDAVVLIQVGRIAHEKDQTGLVQVFERASMQNDNIYLVFVGGGPQLEELKRMVNGLNLNSRVKFTGMIPPTEVADYYRIGDIFACASKSESQGLTYIEALASSLPALCRKDEALDGLLIDGFNGWKWENTDDFIKYLNEFCDNRDKWDEWSKNAVRSVQRYDGDVFVNAILEVYGAAIKRNKWTK